MSKRSRRFAAAMVVGITIATGVGACAPGEKSMTDGQSAASLESAVLAAVPLATGAFVGFASAGNPVSRDVLVRIYVTGPEPSELSAAADATLKAIWGAAPTEPSSVGFEAFDGVKPAKPTNGGSGNIALSAVRDILGTGYLGRTGETLSLSAKELTERYGDWKAPAAR